MTQGVFPTTPDDGTQQGAYEGMTLRDHFASHAPPPPWWSTDATNTVREEWPAKLAAWRYAYADAMMAERAKA